MLTDTNDNEKKEKKKITRQAKEDGMEWNSLHERERQGGRPQEGGRPEKEGKRPQQSKQEEGVTDSYFPKDDISIKGRQDPFGDRRDRGSLSSLFPLPSFETL